MCLGRPKDHPGMLNPSCQHKQLWSNLCSDNRWACQDNCTPVQSCVCPGLFICNCSLKLSAKEITLFTSEEVVSDLLASIGHDVLSIISTWALCAQSADSLYLITVEHFSHIVHIPHNHLCFRNSELGLVNSYYNYLLSAI